MWCKLTKILIELKTEFKHREDNLLTVLFKVMYCLQKKIVVKIGKNARIRKFLTNLEQRYSIFRQARLFYCLANTFSGGGYFTDTLHRYIKK